MSDNRAFTGHGTVSGVGILPLPAISRHLPADDRLGLFS